MFIYNISDYILGAPLLILDRDSTLTLDAGYTYKTADFEWTKFAFMLFSIVSQKKINLAIATNQSGIGRGFFSRNDMEIFHNLLVSQAKLQEVNFNAIYVCPHAPDFKGEVVCSCRKPKPLMLLTARKEAGEPKKTIFVGDSDTDALAAKLGNFDFLSSVDYSNTLTIIEDWVQR